MRFGSRRRTEQVVASYVGILDGRHLWLTLESGGTAQLEGQGRTIPLAEITDLLEVLPGGASDPPSFAIVVDGRPVWSEPFVQDPIRVPTSPDGLTQLQLVRDESGYLSVNRRALVPTALLEAVELRGGDVHLTIRPPGDVQPGTHLMLLDADDQVLGALPVTAHDGHVEALIGVADLPAGYFGVIRLALGTESDWAKIRRRASDLADPHRAVLLPELHDATDDDDSEPRARFRWNPESLLVLRVLEPAELGGLEATVTPIGGGS